MTASRKQDSGPAGLSFIFSEIASFFTSVRTTIVLLFVLAIASVLGTVIPQDLSPDQIQQAAPTVSHRLMVILDLHSIYRSWWFILLLSLLALNLLGCLLKRLPSIPGEWKSGYRKSSFSFTITDSRPINQVREIVSARMQALLHTAPRQLEGEREHTLVWIRDRIQLLGFPLMHAAIIFILLGGLVGLFYGVKGHMLIKEGDSARRFRAIPSGEPMILPFTVSVDKFTLTRYPSGEPKEFRSDVRLLEGDKEVFAGSILVNHPVTYNGISLYQSDYRPTGMIKEVKLIEINKDGGQSDLILRPYEETSISGTPYALRLMSVDPGTTTRGPGVAVRAESSDQENKIIQLFKEDAEPAQLGDKKLRFAEYVPLFATGLQVGYDPGAPIVWTGCISLILGFLLTLFTNHRSVLVEFRTQSETTSVRVSGRSKRLRREFREKVEQAIRESLGTKNTR